MIDVRNTTNAGQVNPRAPRPFRASVAAVLAATAALPVAFGMIAGTAAAADVAVKFDAKDGVGVKISADGHNLLLDDAGAGFYLIGSNDDSDSPNNISSLAKGSRNGVMHTFNGEKVPSLPYKFTFKPDSSDRSKLKFEISVGPSPQDLTVVDLPLDGRFQDFTHWRHANSATPGRYDQNPYDYTPEGGGKTYTAHIPGSPKWGEAIGPDYTVRVTIEKNSDPVKLAFVNAPSLSTGTRNVEFGLSGGLKKGKSATISGYLQVYRTNLPQPARNFESESTSFHQMGRKDGDGWSVRVGDKPNQFSTYGPYVTDIQIGRRVANFRMMVDNATADNNRVVQIQVFDAASGKTLAKRDIARREFGTAMKYKDFALEFTSQLGQSLEFRTFYYGGTYLKQDRVRVE